MYNPLVSIIVPVYNAEFFIEDCVDSLINQTYTNLEILLIDDESKDNSYAKCIELSQKDKRINVFSKKNEGAGLTRNFGIEKSQGKYITFVDSDDMLRQDTILTCIEIFKKYDVDFITYGTRVVNEKKTELYKSIPQASKKLYLNEEVRDLFLPDRISSGKETDKDTNLQCAACMSCFYNNDLLKRINWKFDSEREIFSEDFFAQLKLFKWINSVYVIEDDLYFYRQNTNSLSHNNRVKNFELIKKFYVDCLIVSKENNYNEILNKRLSEPFISYTIVALKYISKNNSFFNAYNEIKRIIYDDVLKEAILQKDSIKDSIKRKIVYWLIIKKKIIILFLLMKYN